MESWRSKALEYLPALQKLIEKVETLGTGPIGLWSELYCELVAAYDAQPPNEKQIERIYDFAGWCLKNAQTNTVETDLPNAVAVAFIESLPLNPRVSEDLHRWMSVDTFKGLETLFRSHLSEEEYRRFSSEFLRRKKLFGSASRF